MEEGHPCRTAVELRILGRVQGVGFRYSTQERAAQLELCGIVRNEPDGSVYVHAEGDSANLAEFLKWCDHGPRSARVEDVIRRETAPQDLIGFRITHGIDQC